MPVPLAHAVRNFPACSFSLDLPTPATHTGLFVALDVDYQAPGPDKQYNKGPPKTTKTCEELAKAVRSRQSGVDVCWRPSEEWKQKVYWSPAGLQALARCQPSTSHQ
jgi:hypothetical protein